MAEMTGGELVVRCLANEGVRFVFGLPCPELDPILAKLGDYDIRLVPLRHEAAGAHMAEGLYKTTGPGISTCTGPGRPVHISRNASRTTSGMRSHERIGAPHFTTGRKRSS